MSDAVKDQATGGKGQRRRASRSHAQFGERRRREGFDHSTDRRMAVDDEALDHKNFTYRFINDEPGRINRLTTKDDWTAVTKDEAGGGEIAYPVGNAPDGSPLFARLHKKPKVWHQDDQSAKIAKSRDEEQELLRRVPTPEGGLNDGKGYTRKEFTNVREGFSRLKGPSEGEGSDETDA